VKCRKNFDTQKMKKNTDGHANVVSNSSSTQTRDLLCFFLFSSVDTHWGSQAKKEKNWGNVFKNWNGCWSRHSVSGDFPSQTAR
jgi:hypothetical protein